MRAMWLAYLLGVMSWIPIVAFAVAIGRWLAQAREVQTRPAQADELSLQPVETLVSAAPLRRSDAADDWAFASADATGAPLALSFGAQFLDPGE